MSNGTRKMRDKQRKRLLEEVGAVEDEVKDLNLRAADLVSKYFSLKGQINALSIISLLPVEILQEIFIILSRLPQRDEQSNLTPWAKWDWLIVTKVCRYWRKVALDCSVLWSELCSFVNEEKIVAFLERSWNADLVLTMGDRRTFRSLPSFSSDIIDLISDDIFRIGILNVSAGSDIEDLKKLLLSLTCNRTSRLKSICLSLDVETQLSVEYGQFKCFLHTIMPNTKVDELRLLSIPVPWNHRILSGLTELTLEQLDIAWQPTLSELLYVLEKCPGLKGLKIVSAGPKIARATINAPSVHLSHLRCLEIAFVFPQVCSNLFEKLDIPPLHTCRITCFIHPLDDPISLHPLFVESTLGSAEFGKIEIKSEYIAFTPHRNTNSTSSFLKFLFSDDSRVEPVENHRIHSLLRSLKIALGEPYWSTKRYILLEISEDDYTELKDFFKENEYIALLEQIPQVETLEIISPSYYDDDFYCLRALTHSSNPQILCPNLMNLQIRNNDFADDGTSDELLYDALVDNLKIRAQRGRPLENLTLINCGIDEAVATSLLEIRICNRIYWTTGFNDENWRVGTVENDVLRIDDVMP